MISLLREFLFLGVIIPPLPNNIQNGQTIDAVPVMADFNWIVSEVNANSFDPTVAGPGVFTVITLGGVVINGFVYSEVPVGVINGAGAVGNHVFTLAAAPSPPGSLTIFHKDGSAYWPGTDYTLAGTTITFSAGNPPQAGDLLRCNYQF